MLGTLSLGVVILDQMLKFLHLTDICKWIYRYGKDQQNNIIAC